MTLWIAIYTFVAGFACGALFAYHGTPKLETWGKRGAFILAVVAWPLLPVIFYREVFGPTIDAIKADWREGARSIKR